MTLANGQTEMFYATGAGTNRLSAWFDAGTALTGASDAENVVALQASYPSVMRRQEPPPRRSSSAP